MILINGDASRLLEALLVGHCYLVGLPFIQYNCLASFFPCNCYIYFFLYYYY